MEGYEAIKESKQKEVMQTREPAPQGVEVTNSGTDDIKITRVRITSPVGEQSIGKPMGNYITLEVPRLRENNEPLQEDVSRRFAEELARVLKLGDKSTILVVGLGNWNVTPDSLGPKVVSKLMVTRHIMDHIPKQINNSVRPVCAIAPGVLGITGIETGEIVRGVVDKIKPELVIAIDALASRKMDRVNSTLQIADTGISPGSGVGNKRMELSIKTLGVPVIAIGVPTVVDAVTLTNDAVELVLNSIIQSAQNQNELKKAVENINRNDSYDIIKKMLNPYSNNLMVTPKEVDEVVEKIANIIANGINIALHKGVTMNDVNRYIH